MNNLLENYGGWSNPILRIVLYIAIITLGIGFLVGETTAEAHEAYDDHRPVLGYAEYLLDPAAAEPGERGIEFFRQDLGNGQLSSDFVYGDPRRAAFNGGNPGITFAVIGGNPTDDANVEDQAFWFRESLYRWQEPECSGLNLTENEVAADTRGAVETFFNTGHYPPVSELEADVVQAGFFTPAEFPYFAEVPPALAVTFTLFWVDAEGQLTDIDDNGKPDVALREIYYDEGVNWADNGEEGFQPDGTYLFDFPTVAIHEAGHGLSAAHFGNIGIQDGELVVIPSSIMSALYEGIQRELTALDIRAHCNNWAQWPYN